MFDLGILGGGQLARMTIQAAQRMGLSCLSIDPDENSPASQIAQSVTGSLNDPDALAMIIDRCNHVTLENEFIPAEAIRGAFGTAKFDESILTPGIDCLATIQDKLTQREALTRAGVPGPRAVAVTGQGEIAAAKIGFPMMLKARFGGYDGKGTRTVRNQDDFDDLSTLWMDGGWLAEEFVDFKRELAVMVYRSPQETGAFPTMETVQSHHVCDLVFPSDVDASGVAIAAVEAVGGYGLFGVELFETQQGAILVNEIAPRPHNTGHYTLDWGGVSQFEQHVRLTMGWPCAFEAGQEACMANLLGQPDARDFRLGIAQAMQVDPQVHIHWYGKAQSRPGRKMGHLNVTGEDVRGRAERARDAFYQGWVGKQ